MEKYKLQQGIFNFLNNKGYSIHDMRFLLTGYALTKGIKRPTRRTSKWYVRISELAQENFSEFSKYYYKQNKLTKNQSYDEWFEESSFDGSFAYNGVTDDF